MDWKGVGEVGCDWKGLGGVGEGSMWLEETGGGLKGTRECWKGRVGSGKGLDGTEKG